MRLRHGSTAPTVYLARDFANRFAERQGELLCPHPAVVRKFAGAALALKKSQSCASASPLLLLPLTKTSSPLSCIVSVWFLRGTRWSRPHSEKTLPRTAEAQPGRAGHPSPHKHSKIPLLRISPDSSPHSSTCGCSLPATI